MPDVSGVTRRDMIQSLGAAGAVALAGCTGGDDTSAPEGTPTDGDTPTPIRTTEADSFELPESEHVNPADFVTGWMLLPPGDDLSAMAYSPSQASEQYETTYAEVQSMDGLYDVFEFHDNDIPETFTQVKTNQWSSVMKVDQLPNNVTEEDVAQQLQDGGYHTDAEIGDFDVYRGGDGGPRAVGHDMHIVSHPIARGDDDSAMQYLDNFLSQQVEGELRPGDDTTTLIAALNVQDSITLRKHELTNLVKGVSESRRAEMGAASVDMDAGEKYGAWVFEDEQTAGTVHAMKEGGELFGYFDEVSQDGRVVTAQGSYNEDVLGERPGMVSNPII